MTPSIGVTIFGALILGVFCFRRKIGSREVRESFLPPAPSFSGVDPAAAAALSRLDAGSDAVSDSGVDFSGAAFSGVMASVAAVEKEDRLLETRERESGMLADGFVEWSSSEAGGKKEWKGENMDFGFLGLCIVWFYFIFMEEFHYSFKSCPFVGRS